jgi:hypothetical protein
MDYEEYEPPECDHDDDVQCTHLFFDKTTSAHLARRRLRNLMYARTHWLVAVTPDCAPYAVALNALHRERCGEAMTVVGMPDLSCQPALCALPRDRVSLDDLAEATQLQITASVEEMPWFLITYGDMAQITQAIGQWIGRDHLLN